MIDGLDGALAKANAARLIKTSRVRAHRTLVEANVASPTDSALLVGRWHDWPRARIKAAGIGICEISDAPAA